MQHASVKGPYMFLDEYVNSAFLIVRTLSHSLL